MNDPQASKQPDGPLELATLTRTCLACPSQWEGTLYDGRAIYVRYRHGELSVGIGADIDEAVAMACPTKLFTPPTSATASMGSWMSKS